MKKTWAVRKDAHAVSPVIATILMVAITVVLAAVLYVMVLGVGTGGNPTPGLQIVKSSTPGGWIFTYTAPTQTVYWNDVTVILEYNGTYAQWTNLSTTALMGSGIVTQNLGGVNQTLDGATKFLNVTDLGGNGQIGNGDYMTITTDGSWVAGHTFKVTLLYELDEGKMVDLQWTV